MAARGDRLRGWRLAAAVFGLPLLGGAGAALGFAGWASWDKWAAPMICEDLRGGRHGLQGCIAPACHAAGDCGLLAAPSQRCSQLEIGDPVAHVVFTLGEPQDRAANPLIWHAGKADLSAGVIARIEDGRLAALSCSPWDAEGRPPPRSRPGAARG